MLKADPDALVPPQPLLQLHQRGVGLLLYQPAYLLLYLHREAAARPVTLLDPFYLARLLPLAGYLPRPGHTYPKPLGQFPQAALPTVVRLQQLPPQIVGI
ncbi:MAG TPA: hypothetical protein VMT20_08750, partial [Terriglobia bacterium]|nr:hypothetical protein [Terriglobia bacterium]